MLAASHHDYALKSSSSKLSRVCLQRLLDDSALEVLVDSSCTSLDLCDSSVSDHAVQNALQSTPHLMSLDLTGCNVSQQTVRSLGSWCPQLQVLRIGWS